MGRLIEADQVQSSYTDIDSLMGEWEESGVDFLTFFRSYEEEKNLPQIIQKRKNSKINPSQDVLEGQLSLFPIENYLLESKETPLKSSEELKKNVHKKRRVKKGPLTYFQPSLF